jgi:hypothetical protein
MVVLLILGAWHAGPWDMRRKRRRRMRTLPPTVL